MITKYKDNLFSLEGKIVIITGAGLIGSEIIRGLIEFGAKVILAEINDAVGLKIEKEFKNSISEVIYKHADITSEESVNNLIDFCTKTYGKIDALINTAFPKTKDWNDKDLLYNYKSYLENLNMHLGGYYLTSIKAAEVMKAQNKGSIVNFGSTYGIVAPDFSIYEGTNMTNKLPYAVIKGGINMLTKYISTYYGKYNVRANVLCPGGVFDNQPEPFVTNYKKKTPLLRMAAPKDIVGPVIFLISDAASYVTGHILMVDGGWTTW